MMHLLFRLFALLLFFATSTAARGPRTTTGQNPSLSVRLRQAAYISFMARASRKF